MRIQKNPFKILTNETFSVWVHMNGFNWMRLAIKTGTYEFYTFSMYISQSLCLVDSGTKKRLKVVCWTIFQATQSRNYSQEIHLHCYKRTILSVNSLFSLQFIWLKITATTFWPEFAYPQKNDKAEYRMPTDGCAHITQWQVC